ncbi:MAG: GFA family protein [Pseudomonadota bacterium]
MAARTTEKTHEAGGCYCGAVRYAVTAPALVKGQCHCRACQHIAGGGPQYFMLIPPDGFAWTKGQPARFARADLDQPVTRFFCAVCGTHMVTQRPDQAALVVKVGTLDDPSRFRPHVAICHGAAPAFHSVPPGIPVFEGLPVGREGR